MDPNILIPIIAHGTCAVVLVVIYFVRVEPLLTKLIAGHVRIEALINARWNGSSRW